jgi:hypothetical protein
MTSPVNVGAAEVTVTASAKGFARSLREAIIREFRSAGLDKVLQEALGATRKVKVPVTPDVDEDSIPEKVKPRRTPKAPVELDPLTKQFQVEVRRQVQALARQVAIGVPVTAETAKLRSELAASLAEIQRQTRIEVPTEPGERREYEAKLRALVDQVRRRVRAVVPVEVSDPQAAREARRAARVAQGAAGPINLRVQIDRSTLRAATSALLGLARTVTLVTGGLAGIGAIGSVGAAGLAGLASAAAGAIPLISGLAAAVATAAGALFALPGAAAVAAAGIGTLALAFAGIGEAIKQTAKQASSGGGGGGGAIVNNTRQIAAAERQLAAAQREARRAQEAVNEAREQARRNLRELAKALRDARFEERQAVFDQEDAQKALAKAQEEQVRAQERLADAQLFGDPDQIREAQRAVEDAADEVERAQLAYERATVAIGDTRERTKELAAEQARATKLGVEGSDEVRAALDRQLAAAEQLAAAQDALAAAQQKVASGGGGGGFNAAAAAMARLAPAARQLVETINRLRPAWEAMQRAVQQAALVGVAADLERMAVSILPTLQRGFVGLARVLNGQMRAGLQELATANTRIRLGSIFDSARTALDSLTRAVQPLLRALLDVSAVGAQVVADLSTGFGDGLGRISERLSEMARSGELRAMIDDGLRALRQFGAAAADVVGIFRGLSRAAGEAGGGGILGFLDRLNTTINSVAGQDALAKLFAELGRIGDALQPVLLAVGQALVPVAKGIGDIAVAAAPTLQLLAGQLGPALASLAPAFIALLPAVDAASVALQPIATILRDLIVGAGPGLAAFLSGLADGLAKAAPSAAPLGAALGDILAALAPLGPAAGELVATFADALVPALQALAPILQAVSRFLADNMTWIGPLATAYLGFAGALKTFRLAQAAANAAMASGVAQFAKGFLGGTAAQWNAASTAAGRMGVAMRGVALAVGQAAAAGARWVASLALQTAQMARNAAVAAASAARTALFTAAQVAASAAAKAWAAVQVVLNAVLSANPIGLVVIAIAALVAGIVLAWKNSETFRKVVTAVWNALVSVVKAAVAKIRADIGRVVAVAQTVGAAFESARRAVSDKIASIVALAKSIPSKIVSALGDVGHLLYNAGKNIIQGLIDGITSKLDVLRDKMKGVASTVRGFLPFSPAKEGPLSGRGNPYYSGQSIVELLAGGVRSRLPVASSAADALAGTFTGLGGDGASLAAPDGNVAVTVLLDGQAIEPRMHKVVVERDRNLKRRVTAGTGGR